MSTDNQTLHLIYFRVTDIWKRFCEEHTVLLDKTFEEYSLLLKSDVEALEVTLQEKQEIVKQITFLEHARERCITELNEYLREKGQTEVVSISELINVMSIYEEHNNARHLYRFNKLLIDVIEKIQEQNKKNQVFLNKAINSLKEIREDALGIKNYSTYNKNGASVRPDIR